MCGFVLKKEVTESVLSLIAHRGKDQKGVFPFGDYQLGFVQLAITDIGTSQPGIFESTRVFLNGEIYNYKDLGNGSECEVLARGFHAEGPEFVKKLNGMFAIAALICGKVYVFRDRYGIKPLYLSESGAASEIKPLVEKAKINVNSEREWLAYNNIFSNETLFEGVAVMPPGSYMCMNDRVPVHYWKWEYKTVPIRFLEAVAEVRRLVIQAIKRQIPSVPYGSCVSAGIDSNIIASIVGGPTFTVGYAGVECELEVAAKYNSYNTQIIYDRVTHFDETIYHLEDLRVGASWPNYGLFKKASESVKVIFDGAGSDELFGGYPWRYCGDYYELMNRTKTGLADRESFTSKYFPVDTFLNRLTFDATHFLPGVLSVTDKLSSAHTIEARVPFLDNDLVDYCLTLPPEYLKDKILLRAAFEDLPFEIVWGKKKGFSSPDWIEGEGNQANKWAVAALNKWKQTFL